LALLGLAAQWYPVTVFSQVALRTYEVYFESRDGAARAVAELDGSTWEGRQLQVSADSRFKDQTRLIVRGSSQLPPWRELRPVFEQCGTVKFIQLRATDSFMEVRFENAVEAGRALELFNETELLGRTVIIEREGEESPRVWVHGLPPFYVMTDVKKRLKEAGNIKFCGVHNHNAEVRFEAPADAMDAIERLDGSELSGYTLSVVPHQKTQDGTKVLVSGLGAGVEWQDLKDHFQQVGKVVFTAIKKSGG